jgi:hypothetical protein
MRTFISLFFVIAALLSPQFSLAEQGPDGRVIEQLKKAGANLDKPHPIEFFFYFPTQDRAERIASRLRRDGYTATFNRAAKGQNWVVQATKEMIPNEIALNKLRKKFEAIAADEKGEYDGWGTPVVK